MALWLVAGAISEIAFRIKLGVAPLAESWRRAIGLPRSSWGTALAHAGLGLTVLGIIAATTWGAESIRSMKPGDTETLAGYDLTLVGFNEHHGAEYNETGVQFDVRRGGALVGTMEPSKRTYVDLQTSTSQAALKTIWLSQIYISIGDIAADGTTTVRSYWKPLVTLTWLGAIVMALGGLMSLSDRRLRVGVPKASRRRRDEAAGVPAE
jgi:cytochrome c-type biogenesis protein CcmF